MNSLTHKYLILCINANFVGKSAVLAAIQICLGANARRTHRARNLKDLVRRDASANMPTGAKIRVTLYNRGSDAYQHEVYGDTITVERTISLRAGGDNGYKLLDHNNVVKSKSKKDLDDMLDTLYVSFVTIVMVSITQFFVLTDYCLMHSSILCQNNNNNDHLHYRNIQVDNPVAVLDQEEAKKFLTGKAEDKYNFFMKATELERVDRTYASTLDTITELENINIRIKEGLQTSYEHVEDLKRKWNEHQELDKLEQKRSQLGTDYAWSLYNESDELYQKNFEVRGTIA